MTMKVTSLSCKPVDTTADKYFKILRFYSMKEASKASAKAPVTAQGVDMTQKRPLKKKDLNKLPDVIPTPTSALVSEWNYIHPPADAFNKKDLSFSSGFKKELSFSSNFKENSDIGSSSSCKCKCTCKDTTESYKQDIREEFKADFLHNLEMKRASNGSSPFTSTPITNRSGFTESSATPPTSISFTPITPIGKFTPVTPIIENVNKSNAQGSNGIVSSGAAANFNKVTDSSTAASEISVTNDSNATEVTKASKITDAPAAPRTSRTSKKTNPFVFLGCHIKNTAQKFKLHKKTLKFSIFKSKGAKAKVSCESVSEDSGSAGFYSTKSI